MIGLDSYSRQVFIYLDPILIYISLWIDCLFEIRKIAVCFLWLSLPWMQGHWWGFISRNYVVWPTFLLMNVFIALKGSHFWFFFIKLFILVGWGRSFFVCCLAHRGSNVGFLLLQCSSGVVRHPRDIQVSVATRCFCRVLIFVSS